MDGSRRVRDPLVSVIIPTYQRGHTLSRAIGSALGQDYPSLEVVVSDNASTDNTSSVLEGFTGDKRLRVVRQPRNIGPVANWRAALDSASGDLIKVNWSDDWMEPHVVGHLVRALQRSERVGFAIVNQTIHHRSGVLRTGRSPGLVRIEDVAGSVVLGLGLPVSPGAGLVGRQDVEWALTEGADALSSDCMTRAIGPDLLMLYGALRRGLQGTHTGAAGVHFVGGYDSITVNEDPGVLRSCYLNALFRLIQSTGKRRVGAMVHQLLAVRRLRGLRASLPSPQTKIDLAMALNPAALPLTAGQLLVERRQR